MQKYFSLFTNSLESYARYFFHEITTPSWHNYFYLLIGVSILFWLLEIAFPWRKNQNKIRHDFWLDGFYMFFNFFLFSLIGFYAISTIVVQLFSDFLTLIHIKNGIAIEINFLPLWAKLMLGFLVKDFIQWNVHRLLHKNSWLWQFHKLHHSVKEMGFAAHLRFHWMENVIYNIIQYIPLAMLGFGIQDYIVINMFALTIGHFNHANIHLPIGPFKYVFNNPQMHIWHHAASLPKQYKNGANFGISLSIWDYLFRTNYIPYSGRDIPLGFDDDTAYPKDFIHQELYPILKEKKY